MRVSRLSCDLFQIIEITETYLNKNYGYAFLGVYIPDLAIKDLNIRFLENGMGYSFQDGKIIRIDNTLLHQEVILETLSFLSSPIFKNANSEGKVLIFEIGRPCRTLRFDCLVVVPGEQHRVPQGDDADCESEAQQQGRRRRQL